MILADKIIKLRKKNGWSQEELADKMNVSRQAVSKWEGALTIPDLEKILQLASLFGVTTDYLLKDEIEDEEFTKEDEIVKKVSMEDANEFLSHTKAISKKMAIATFLCIISPTSLFILLGISQENKSAISEELATLLGLLILILLVVFGVAIFMYCAFKNEPYKYLNQTDSFKLEYGVKGMVKEKQKAFRNKYACSNIIATSLCIISPIPLIASTFTKNDLLVLIMLDVTILIVGIAVVLFVANITKWNGMQKILSEGEFSKEKAKKSKVKDTISTIYWIVITVIFLAWSFIFDAWKISWIVWLIGGLIFPLIMVVCDVILDKEK